MSRWTKICFWGLPGAALWRLWTSRSLRKLSEELANKEHQVSRTVVGERLHQQGYGLQANRKTREGHQHMDRDAQFQYIAARATFFLKDGQPVVSVDTKKKELVGNFKNAGRECRPQVCKPNPRKSRQSEASVRVTTLAGG